MPTLGLSTLDWSLTGWRPFTWKLRKAAETAQALADDYRRQLDALRYEMGAIEHAAHMPVDYAYGLPTWINMVLYAAYIGLDIGPHNRAWAVRVEERWEAAVAELRATKRELVAIREERDRLMSELGEACQGLTVGEEL